ncbi:extracellular solute-binding protein [Rhodococcus jostii]|uniref:Extracellular solute-binding protein n=1 Tax=Rhodococcus jostii TaxID=132919 RepID=A0ABU4CN05_RHOJO|nr:extracellular solute-binding protein [Rhodococcus jostii]MDV6284955.1 extracellular solute-binding protein [Rhodococcus jostii]
MSALKRHMTRAVAAALGLVLAAALAGCTNSGGPETIRFAFPKPESLPFMTEQVNKYNASQDEVHVVLDTSATATMVAGFVRGTPPDIALNNYNHETSRFVDHCVLSDLSDTPAAQTIRPELGVYMDQYGTCPGRTSALPFSVMAAGVIYNKEIFAEHGVEVPQTWDEFIAACERFKAAGVTPIYATYAEPWTVGQGLYDYTVGGTLDTVSFFEKLHAEGVDVGPDAPVSFEKDQAEPVDRMLQLTQYVNSDAASRGYPDGNTAMAQGKAAMYMQGPWALSEIAKTSPDLQVGTFPLPMTNDPADAKVRINVDLAAWIPEGSAHQEAARKFLDYLYQPEVIGAYNAEQLGFDPTTSAVSPTDPRILGLAPYVDANKVYQGPSVLMPRAIPLMNYTQSLVLGESPEKILRTIDADFARLAFRQQ